MNLDKSWMYQGFNKKEPNNEESIVDQVSIPIMRQNEQIVEMNEDFDINGFQVVRREFFAHLREPSATFDKCKFYVNASCIAKFPDADYAQVLVNQKSKILALRPCKEKEKDAFAWSKITKGKRKPKQITCKLFYAKIFSLMGWDPNNRYKLLGRVVHSNGLYLVAFDLNATEVYQRVVVDDKIKTSRKPIFPVDWQDQFGLTYEEHKQSMQINVFDGYAVYAIKEGATTPEEIKKNREEKEVPIKSNYIMQQEQRMEGSMNV